MPTLLVKGSLRSDIPHIQEILNSYVPIDFILDWIRKHENESGPRSRFLVLVAETASGKSTTLPAEIYIKIAQYKPINAPSGIISTQPRVLNAISIPNQIIGIPEYAKYLSYGNNLAYLTKGIKLRPVSHRGIVFMTIGILQTMLQDLPIETFCNKYHYIIVDEVHNRSLQTDLTLNLLRNILWTRTQSGKVCPFIILTSATIQAQKYIDYFLSEPGQPIQYQKMRTGTDVLMTNYIFCSGMSYHKDYIYLDNPVGTTYDSMMTIISGIIEAHPSPDIYQDNSPREADDILIFVPGLAETKKIRRKLENFNTNLTRKLLILELDSSAVRRESLTYIYIMSWLKNVPGPKYDRRVIISTNVAETGITIETLRYVIDFGYDKRSEYSPRYKLSALITTPETLSQVSQRSGRIGRKFPGVYYGLYQKSVLPKLVPDQLPEILTSNILSVIINYMATGPEQGTFGQYFDNLQLLDNPMIDSLTSALEDARLLGLISRDQQDIIELTRLGRFYRTLSSVLEPHEVRFLVIANMVNYSMDDAISIISYIKSGGPHDIVVETFKDKRQMLLELFKARIRRRNVLFCEAFNRAFSRSFRDNYELAIQDTFIEAIVYYHAIDQFFNTLGPEELVYRRFFQWSLEHNLDHWSVRDTVTKRDEIRTAVYSSGLFNLSNESILKVSINRSPNMASIFLKYKFCIYEGFKIFSVHWNEIKNRYETMNGGIINNSIFSNAFGIKKSKIQNAVLSSYFTKANASSGVFEVSNEDIFVSCFDGLFPYDPEFLS